MIKLTIIINIIYLKGTTIFNKNLTEYDLIEKDMGNHFLLHADISNGCNTSNSQPSTSSETTTIAKSSTNINSIHEENNKKNGTYKHIYKYEIVFSFVIKKQQK